MTTPIPNGRPASRWLLLGGLAAAAVLAALEAFELVTPRHDANILGLVTIVLLALPVTTSAVVRRLEARRPAPRLEVADGVGFVVPANRVYTVYLVAQVVGAVVVGRLVVRGWSGYAVRRLDPAAILLVALTMVVLLMVVAVGSRVVIALLGRPPLVLTPEAIRLEDGTSRRTIPWAALTSTQPVAELVSDRLTLALDHPELIVRSGPTLRRHAITVWLLRVDHGFLVDVLRHYARHPEHRASIGTLTGYEQLLAELGRPAAV